VLPLSFAHSVPQAPQWSASLVRSCSQPVSTSSSQSPKPSSQAIAQPRLVHDGVPFTVLHVTPHILQLSTVPRLVSHASGSCPLQSAKPSGQSLDVHTPPLQRPEAQGTRQRPQFVGFEIRSVSQPFAALPSHSPSPVSHGPGPHAPLMHCPVASHAAPHWPQLTASVSGFRHCPSQHEKPPGHVALSTQLGMQTAPSQRVPGAQSASPAHPVQLWFGMSQLMPGQSASLAQPIPQRLSL